LSLVTGPRNALIIRSPEVDVSARTAAHADDVMAGTAQRLDTNVYGVAGVALRGAHLARAA